jgi:hypothetical protein
MQFDKLNNEFQIGHELGIRTSPFGSNFLWLTQASIEVPAEPCNIGSGHPSPGAGRYITSGGLICKRLLDNVNVRLAEWDMFQQL